MQGTMWIPLFEALLIPCPTPPEDDGASSSEQHITYSHCIALLSTACHRESENALVSDI